MVADLEENEGSHRMSVDTWRQRDHEAPSNLERLGTHTHCLALSPECLEVHTVIAVSGPNAQVLGVKCHFHEKEPEL